MATCLAVVAVGVLLPAAAAHAHTFTSYHNSDPSWTTIDGDHQHYAVCDADNDGHDTWIRIDEYGKDPRDWYSSGHDTYGRNANGQFCWHSRITGFYWMRRFAVCVSYEGCTAWRDVT